MLVGRNSIESAAFIVEAMSSDRPYRPGKGIAASLEELEKNSGVLYDAEIVEICIRLFRNEKFAWGS